MIDDLVTKLRFIRTQPFRERHRATIVQAADEIERLQKAKRAALAIADERSKENVRLRKALEQIRDDILCDPKQVAEDALSDVGTQSNG